MSLILNCKIFFLVLCKVYPIVSFYFNMENHKLNTRTIHQKFDVICIVLIITYCQYLFHDFAQFPRQFYLQITTLHDPIIVSHLQYNLQFLNYVNCVSARLLNVWSNFVQYECFEVPFF